MKKSNNRGVSLIEILIAVVVFVICITPIINQLVNGIRLGQKADDQQAATDLGKSISEAVRQMDLNTIIDYPTCHVDKAALASILNYSGNKDNIDVTYSFYSIGSDCLKDEGGHKVIDLNVVKARSGTVGVPYGSYIKEIDSSNKNMTHGAGSQYNSVTAMQQAVDLYNKTHTADEKQVLVRELTVKWTDTVDYRNYDVSVVLNTAPFAIASLTNTSYVDPNSVNIGNLSNLDSRTTAVITSASSYDTIAASSYFASVLNALERQGNDRATLLREGQVNAYNDFTSQTPQKETIITIKNINTDGSEDSNGNRYTVKCDVRYTNNTLRGVNYGNLDDSEVILEYPAYEQDFALLPDIYLMYNQLYYFNTFGDDDIIIDNQLISGQEAKVYIVRTAETDPDGNPLVGIGTFGRDQKDGAIYKYRTIFHFTQNVTNNPVRIYTNIPLTDGSNSNVSKYSDNNLQTKIAVDCTPAGSYDKIVYRMDEDDRYSEAGRVYDVEIELQRWKSGSGSTKNVTNITTYSTSKGDS